MFKGIDQNVAFGIVEKHIEKKVVAEKKPTKKTALAEFKKVYIIVKPILQYLETFPLLPAKWRSLLAKLNQVIEVLIS